jgi:hypothetical protein
MYDNTHGVTPGAVAHKCDSDAGGDNTTEHLKVGACRLRAALLALALRMWCAMPSQWFRGTRT